jgi:hypothetical protein
MTNRSISANSVWVTNESGRALDERLAGTLRPVGQQAVQSRKTCAPKILLEQFLRGSFRCNARIMGVSGWHMACVERRYTRAEPLTCGSVLQHNQNRSRRTVTMKLNQMLVMAGIAAVMTLSASKLVAQNDTPKGDRRGRGNFDPAQMQERMMEGVREQFAIKDDAEWKAIEPLVKKVMDGRREAMVGGMGMMFRRPGGDNNGGGQDRSRRFGGEPGPEVEALQKAIEAKASKEELKTKMAAVRKVKQANEAKLKAAQDELKKVLTVPQEAAALQMGLVQ